MNIFKKYIVVFNTALMCSLFLSTFAMENSSALSSINVEETVEVDENLDQTDKFVFREIEHIEFNENYKDIVVEKITNDKSYIKGKTFKDSIVKFYINDVEYVSSTDDEGNFTLLLEEGLLVDADQISMKVCDYVNNELSRFSFVVHDVLPPIDPNLNNVINNSDSIIRGYGEPNSAIKILINDSEFTGHTYNNGNFEIEVGDSLMNANKVKLISYDYFNNYSNLVEAGVRDIIGPHKPMINVVDSENSIINGTGEPNCEVLVSLDDKVYKTFVNEDGNFSVFDEEGIIVSTNLIKVKLIDSSGNRSEESYFELEKEDIGKIILKSLDVNNHMIKDAMIKVNGPEEYILKEDQIFNLNSEGNLILEDLPFGNYELVIRYRTNDYSLAENVLNINLDEINSEIEVLID